MISKDVIKQVIFRPYRYLSLLLFLSIYIMSYSQTGSPVYLKTDDRLQQSLEKLVQDFHGTAGIYVENLASGQMAAVHADTVFPTASIIKVPIMLGVFTKIKAGELSFHQPLIYDTSRFRGGSGLVQYFKDSTKTSLDVLLSLMIGYSDNIAALWCQELAGGGSVINQLLESMGYKNTRVNSRTKGREKGYQLYGWGQTTPREMADILKQIRAGQAVDKASSDRMYRYMSHIFYDGYALSQIPPYIQTASKQGMVNDSRSELVMVNAPHGDYVFYVATKNNKDERWENDCEAWVLARKVSALLWQHFEPEAAKHWSATGNRF